MEPIQSSAALLRVKDFIQPIEDEQTKAPTPLPVEQLTERKTRGDIVLISHAYSAQPQLGDINLVEVFVKRQLACGKSVKGNPDRKPPVLGETLPHKMLTERRFPHPRWPFYEHHPIVPKLRPELGWPFDEHLPSSTG